MKKQGQKQGPFSERLYLSPSHVEAICEQALLSVGLMPESPSQTRIERFIEKKFGICPEYSSLPSGVLGYTTFTSSGPARIVVDRTLSEANTIVADRRINTTLAHEAGHCLFHSDLFKGARQSEELFAELDIESSAPKILCRDEPSPTYQGKWWEHQANLAIGALLLPKQLTIAASEPFLDHGGVLGIAFLPDRNRRAAELELAEIFNVNPAVVRIRLAELYASSTQMTL